MFLLTIAMLTLAASAVTATSTQSTASRTTATHASTPHKKLIKLTPDEWDILGIATNLNSCDEWVKNQKIITSAGDLAKLSKQEKKVQAQLAAYRDKPSSITFGPVESLYRHAVSQAVASKDAFGSVSVPATVMTRLKERTPKPRTSFTEKVKKVAAAAKNAAVPPTH